MREPEQGSGEVNLSLPEKYMCGSGNKICSISKALCSLISVDIYLNVDIYSTIIYYHKTSVQICLEES